ncbi:MAG: NAD(P)H-hydrate dehydratase [Pseudobdellovibrio sp.]
MNKRILSFESKQALKILPKRKKTDNKASCGKSLIIAGSKGMFGAAILAATAAARVGSGYVLLMTIQKKFSSLRNPDFLVIDSKRKKIKDISFSAIGIGPGLGQTTHSLQLLKQLIKLKPAHVVIDADALNLLAKNRLLQVPKSWIATPHEGELAKLLRINASAVRKDRLNSVIQAQKKLGCIVLLKGHNTLVATNKKVFKIKSGNSALAKAGTGDVLTGMITGFLAQGLEAAEAACLGGYLHGAIADQWVMEKNDILSLMATDILNRIPKVMQQIRKNKNTAITFLR